MSNIAENLLVQLIDRRPDDVDLVVILDTATGREGKFPVTDIPALMNSLTIARQDNLPVIDIDGILIEQAAWPSLSYALGEFMGASLDQFSADDVEDE